MASQSALVQSQDIPSAWPTNMQLKNQVQTLSADPTTPKENLHSTSDRKGPRLDEKDLAYLVNHLSSKANREILTGSGSKPKVGGLSQGAEWSVLSSKLSNAHNDCLRLTSTNHVGKMNMTGGDLMKRWNRIKSKYVETKKYWNRTGAGILEGEGYQTIEEKKEAMCPMFKELDAIYGDKPNIKALKVHDSMLHTNSEGIFGSKQSTSITPLSQSLKSNTKNNRVSYLNNDRVD